MQPRHSFRLPHRRLAPRQHATQIGPPCHHPVEELDRGQVKICIAVLPEFEKKRVINPALPARTVSWMARPAGGYPRTKSLRKGSQNCESTQLLRSQFSFVVWRRISIPLAAAVNSGGDNLR